MKLYNTLTRTVQNFEPQSPERTAIYTCGPTVYDYQHIGNYFTYVREDTLIRVLTIAGYAPDWVMNITDVGHLVSDADEGEDKLEKGAKREGMSAWEVAKFYTDRFLEDLDRLHIFRPGHLTKATEHIPQQIALIQKLEEKGFTYIISDGVYYDTSKFSRYADFARLDTAKQQEGIRVEANPEKRNPTDFALWKFSPKDRTRDMEWNSPWGKGFPGWHIECSAMAMKYLGETLDIHAGGIDHIPVHHTNEIAQSEAVTGKPFSRFWFHANHIMINGHKIAKSAGNGIRLQDIEKAGFSAEAFRLLVLESHYRTQSHFSWDTLESAANRLRSYQTMAVRRWQDFSDNEGEGLMPEELASYKQAILSALENDLNTPEALAELSKLADAIDSRGINISSQDAFTEFLGWLDQAFGLQITELPDITPEQKRLIADRKQARNRRDWAESDEIRNHLASQGIGIRDSIHGSTIWFRD